MVSKSARRRSKDSACSGDSTQISRIKRADERTRTADLLITSIIIEGCQRVQRVCSVYSILIGKPNLASQHLRGVIGACFVQPRCTLVAHYWTLVAGKTVDSIHPPLGPRATTRKPPTSWDWSKCPASCCGIGVSTVYPF